MEMIDSDTTTIKSEIEDISHNKSLPKIIIFTDERVNSSHGSGTALLRHFNQYPQQNILNVFRMELSEGGPGFLNNFKIDIKNMETRYVSKKAKEIIRHLNATEFIPTIIYSVFYSAEGICLLRNFLKMHSLKLPVIQHFFDYRRGEKHAIENELIKLSSYTSEIWALNSTISKTIEKILNRNVSTVRIFHCDLSPHNYKQDHREFDQSFRTVMIGNFWEPKLINDIVDVWKWVGKINGPILPIQWFCHPGRIKLLLQQGYSLGDEVEHIGFFQGEELQEKLAKFDMAIIPFNRENNPESDYAKYSIPSRITEIANAGLPMFFAAGRGTDVWNYVESTKIGVSFPPGQIDMFRNGLIKFIQDRAIRESCGGNARILAENEFDIKKYQTFLYTKLSELSISDKHSRNTNYIHEYIEQNKDSGLYRLLKKFKSTIKNFSID